MGSWIDVLVYRYEPNLTPLISLRVGLFLLKLSINLKCPTPTQTIKESPTNHPRVVTKIDTPTLLSTYTSYPYVYIYVHTLQQIIYKCAWFCKRKRQRNLCCHLPWTLLHTHSSNFIFFIFFSATLRLFFLFKRFRLTPSSSVHSYPHLHAKVSLFLHTSISIFSNGTPWYTILQVIKKIFSTKIKKLVHTERKR